MVVKKSNRDVLKDNSQKTTIMSSKKGSPLGGRWGSWLLGSGYQVRRAPLYVVWQPSPDSAPITYHTALVKASDERIQCQILGED